MQFLEAVRLCQGYDLDYHRHLVECWFFNLCSLKKKKNSSSWYLWILVNNLVKRDKPWETCYSIWFDSICVSSPPPLWSPQDNNGVVFYLNLDVVETNCSVLSKRHWKTCETRTGMTVRLNVQIYAACNRPQTEIQSTTTQRSQFSPSSVLFQRWNVVRLS